MTLPSFESAWRQNQRIKPRISVLEVRDRSKPDGKPIAWLFVERQEHYRQDSRDGQVYGASIRLSYETIEPRHKLAVSGEFSGSYSRGHQESAASLALVGGALFLDPLELRGQRIGTYLMNEIVTWAQQWPEATVSPVTLLAGQAEHENRARRNRFYERFGLVFVYKDAEHREGVSLPMPVKELTPVTSWQENIRERDPREYLAELIYERSRMATEAAQRDTAVKNLSRTLSEARDRPVRWAARVLWGRVSSILLQGAFLAALCVLAWMALQGT